MFEMQGKYNKCKVFTDNCDESTIGQLTALLNQQSIEDSKIRIMSDCHAGAGCVIGTTMTITDKVIPNLVGVDIGCGMYVVKIKEKRIDLPKLDSIIRKEIPAGFDSRKTVHRYVDNIKLSSLHAVKFNAISNMARVINSVGTLGGGNHFIEVNKDKYDRLYLVIHTGSRNLGKQVAEYYQERAWERLKNGNRQELIKQKIDELTKFNKENQIESAIKKIKSTMPIVPHELAYCDTDLFKMYIEDMKITQQYAYWNRVAIADDILKFMHLHAEQSFTTVHNYIDTDNMILRKGAVSASKGEKLIIPMNMRDGSLLCIGKGNDDWNKSAPHGAGRICSRSQAKERFTVSEFKKTMKENHVFTTSVGQSTLDECPMAYKPMEEIISNIGDTVDITEVIKPIYNFKSGGE